MLVDTSNYNGIDWIVLTNKWTFGRDKMQWAKFKPDELPTVDSLFKKCIELANKWDIFPQDVVVGFAPALKEITL